MKKLLPFLILLTSLTQAHAAEVNYVVTNQMPVSDMIHFSIPYSMGVHEGFATEMSGGAVTDEADHVIRAQFQVPISSMRTGDSTRDCHMREALGLQYNQTRFPGHHVCDSNNQLPASGPESIQHPYIVFDMTGISLPTEPFTIGVPKASNVQVRIQIHGVEQTKVLPVMITKTVSSNGTPGFNLSSQFPLSLREFGVEVKPVSILGMKIGVKDQLKVQVGLNLIRN